MRAMKTVTIDVRPLAASLGDFTQAWKSGKASAPRISFETPELLFKVMSGKRWGLLNAGLISKTDDGMIVFPYDAIHVDFMLKTA
jgi:hypothetical protein